MRSPVLVVSSLTLGVTVTEALELASIADATAGIGGESVKVGDFAAVAEGPTELEAAVIAVAALELAGVTVADVEVPVAGVVITGLAAAAGAIAAAGTATAKAEVPVTGVGVARLAAAAGAAGDVAALAVETAAEVAAEAITESPKTVVACGPDGAVGVIEVWSASDPVAIRRSL